MHVALAELEVESGRHDLARQHLAEAQAVVKVAEVGPMDRGDLHAARHRLAVATRDTDEATAALGDARKAYGEAGTAGAKRLAKLEAAALTDR